MTKERWRKCSQNCGMTTYTESTERKYICRRCLRQTIKYYTKMLEKQIKNKW